MKKILMFFVILVVIVIAGGYFIIQNNTTAKGVYSLNKVLNAKTPSEVKQIIADNQDVVNDLKKQGVLKDSDIQTINNTLDKMEKENKNFNKTELADIYLKGKIPDAEYNKVKDIMAKDQLSIGDKAELVKLITQFKK